MRLYSIFDICQASVRSDACVHAAMRYDGGVCAAFFCSPAGRVRGGVVGGTTNPSPSTDRQYRNFNPISYIKPVPI
jgi:hypothetical protein